MSFWGCIVITNLFYCIPCSIAWMCGDFYVSNYIFLRVFILHIMLSLIYISLIYLHLLYLHYISSTNILGYDINIY